ncbi:MAG TPA: choice-of-anchor V domain-containing protein [Polyangiales bacterium]
MKRFAFAFAVLGLALSAARPAHAFHAAKTFADSPDQGGAGGIFYTGARDERGWTCAACHVNAPGKLQVQFTTTLFNDFSYTPGQTYEFTLRMLNEQKGLDAPRANYNAFVLRIADDNASAVGNITGAAADAFYMRGNSAGETSIIATQGQKPGETSWKFSWIAPAKGRGDVTFSLGVVDGNAAGAGPDSTLNDPFGDDLYTARVTVHEAKPQHAVSVPLLPSGDGAPRGPQALAWLLGLLGLAAMGVRRLGLRR